MKNITVRCETDTCQNVLVLHGDDYLIKRWTCPKCQDAIEAQMLDDLWHRIQAKRHAAQHELTTQEKH